MLAGRRLLTLAVACMSGTAIANAAVIRPEKSDQAWLGVMLGNAGEKGIEILDVIGDDSPAATAGLQKGDIITRFNGESLADLGAFVQAVQNSKPGQQAAVDVQRDGKELSLSVTLGARPADADQIAPRAFAFRFKGQGPRWFLHHGGAGWPEELHRILRDVKFGEGGVKLNVECEDGKGAVTIEQGGKTETHEFNCQGDWNENQVFQWHGGDFDADNFNINIPEMPEIDLPEIKMELRDKLLFHGDGPGKMLLRKSPTTRFNVDANGGITVTVNKGEDELSLSFDNAEALEKSRPDLYEKYEDLMSELDE